MINSIGILQHGNIENILIIDSTINKNLEDGEVLVDVSIFSINRLDLEIVLGIFLPSKDYPLILGYEFCGRVIQTKSKKFFVNDVVYGSLPIFNPGVKQNLIVSENWIIKKPNNTASFEAVVLPLSFQVSYQALTAFSSISGKNILINGSGCISYMSVQIAKNLGAKSITVISSYKKSNEFLKLSVDNLIINTKEEDIINSLENCDFVFDTACDMDLKNVYKYIKKGFLVSINLNQITEKFPIILKLNPKIKLITYNPSYDCLHVLNNWLSSWRIKPIKHEIYNIKDYKSAFLKKDNSRIEKFVLKF